MSKAIPDLPAYDEETGLANVIIETPKGARNKFKFDDKKGMFRLSRTLPAGTVFPYDFGYLPATQGADGDPLDVLVLMDEPAFAGCLVPSRLVGVIEAEQTEKGKNKPERNDRLIAIAAYSQEHQEVEDLGQLPDTLLDQIEHFFASYNEFEGKKFKPIGRKGPDAAARLIKQGLVKKK